MAANYDDIIDSESQQSAPETPDLVASPVATNDKYDAILDGETSGQKELLTQSMFVATKRDPERYAQAQVLAGKSGLPTETVERQFDQVKKDQEFKAFGDNDIVRRSPKLAKWLTDPENASVAHDDLQNLQSIEKQVKQRSFGETMYSSLKSGAASMVASAFKIPAAAIDIVGTAAYEGKYLPRPFHAPEILRNNFITDFYETKAQEYKTPEMDASVVDELADGNWGNAGAALASQVVSNAPQQALNLAGLFTGYAIPALAFGGMTTAADVNDRSLDAGKNPEDAAMNALGQGTIETAFESLPLGFIEHWSKQLTKKIGTAATGEVIKGFVTSLAAQGAVEGTEEFATQIAQDFTESVTMGTEFNMKQSLHDAANAFLIGAGSGTAMSTPAGIVAGVARGEQSRSIKAAKEFYLSLGDTVEASKLRARQPEAMAKAVNEITKDSPVEHIYIPVEAANEYFQSQKMSPAAAAQKLGILSEYEEASVTGADIKVPLGTFVSKVVGTEFYQGLASDVKFSPEAQTENEAKRDAEDAKTKLEQADKEATASAENPDAGARMNDAQAKIERQLLDAGRSVSEAKYGAQLLRSGVESMLKHFPNLDPVEEFAKYGLDITGPQAVVDAAQVLNQDDQRIERAKKMGFNTDQPLYHGTSENFQSFDNEKSKRSYWGTGTYLTADEGEAGTYGKTILKTFVRSQKQFDVLRDEPPKSVIEWMKKNHPKDHKDLVKAIGKDGLAYNYLDAAKNVIPAKTLTELLQSEGYDSLKMGEIVNVFDNKNIKSTDADFNESESGNIYTQTGDDEIRGKIAISPDRKFNIQLLRKADESTFLHETGHFFLEMMGDLATREDAPQAIKDDFEATLKWLGVESRDQIKTKHHEQWAEGIEAYLQEGRAPSAKLRKAFARFRLWLTQVYKGMKQLEIPLTDEVRDVMDRMLAADEEIAQANVAQFRAPLDFKGQYGMNQEVAQRYYEAHETAREAELSKLNAKLQAIHQKEKSDEYKEKRAVTRKRVAEEVSNQQVYKTIETLQKGALEDLSGTAEHMPDGATAKIKLSKTDLINMIGADQFTKVKELKGRPIYSRENGMHPNIAATLLGYADGHQMVQDILNAPEKEYLIDRLTDESMNEQYPDLLTDGKLPQEAMDAVHNEKRSQIMRLELEHMMTFNKPVVKDLIRRISKRVPSDAQVKAQAAGIIAAKSITELRPDRFMLAERKAAKEAGVLLAKGDIDGAFNAKLKELLNHELYRAATAARQDIVKRTTGFRKIVRGVDEKLAKSRDMDMVSVARAILAAHGIGKKDVAPAEYLKGMKSYDPDGYQNALNLIEMATQNVGPYKEMKYGDFQDMGDAVDAIWERSRTMMQNEIDGEKRDRFELIDELNSQIGTFSEPGVKVGQNKAATDNDKWRVKLLGARATLTRVEHWSEAMDVDKVGPFVRYIFQPISKAETKYRLANEVMKKKLEKLLRGYEKNLDTKTIMSEELQYDFTKPELIMAILHSGNDSNLDKLLRGRNWGETNEDGTLDRSRWDKFMQRAWREGIINKADMDFAQEIWNLMEEMKPDSQKAHHSMYGYYFKEITANEITTPFGKYKGGYIPAKVDLMSSEDAAIRSERETFENNNNTFAFPTTGRGATKSRVQAYAAPLSLDFKLIGSHIDWAMRFTHIEPRVKEVARIVSDKDFRARLGAHDSEVARRMLIPWLQRTAQQKVVEPGKYELVDNVASVLRKNTAMQIMFGGVTNALQQTTGLAVAMSKVKGRNVMGGLMTYIKDVRGTVDSVMEKSEFMRSTQGSNIYEAQQGIQEILTNPTTFQSMKAFAARHVYFLQSATQNVVNTTVWVGAYNQATENGKNEAEAVQWADAIVRTTQGTNNPSDISAHEVGTPVDRLFTQFAGYFNMLGNLNQSELQKISRDVGLKSKPGASRAFALYVTAGMVPAVVAQMMVQIMAGKGLDADDDDEYLDDLLSLFFFSQINTGLAMIPVVGPTIVAGMNTFNDNRNDDRLSLSPVMSTVETVLGTGREAYDFLSEGKGKRGKVIKDVLMAVGIATGLPTAPLSKPLNYQLDVNDGTKEPSGAADYVRGMITGK